MPSTVRKKIIGLSVSGCLLIVLGIAFFFGFPAILDTVLKHKLLIEKGSYAYKYWKDIPIPIYIDFYFFNVTNTGDVYALKSKPILEEVGPYTFQEVREKVGMEWNDNGTLSYRQIKRWYFQPDMSKGRSLDDIVTTLNVPMVAAAATAKTWNKKWMYMGLEGVFWFLKSKWFIHKPVRQLLFDGYKDRLIQMGKIFMKMPYDKFGWFYERNGTDDGQIVAFSGESDIYKVGKITRWKGSDEVPGFSSPCNSVSGSAGDVWGPDLTKDQSVSLFVTDICRHMSFSYEEDITVKSIEAYRYAATIKALDNGEYDPSNKCFCPGGKCLPAGACNVSACKFDAPAVVSYPHYLYADSIYSEGVIGMKPDPAKHKMYLDLVPKMGIPVGVAARMQINIVLDPIPEISQFRNLTNRTYFPVFWFSETADITDAIASEVGLVVNTLPLIFKVISFLLLALGCCLALSALVYYNFHRLKMVRENSLDRDHLIDDSLDSSKKVDTPYSAVEADNEAS